MQKILNIDFIAVFSRKGGKILYQDIRVRFYIKRTKSNSRLPLESAPSRPSGHMADSGPEAGPLVDPAPELEGGGGLIFTSPPTAAAAAAAARNSSRKAGTASGGTVRDFLRSAERTLG